MNEFKLNYKTEYDVDLNLNGKDLDEVMSLSLAMSARDLPVIALTFDLSNVELDLNDTEIDIKLNSFLPNDLQEIILKDIREYYAVNYIDKDMHPIKHKIASLGGTSGSSGKTN
jgi:hypothetical protein